ncbi:MAG: glycosyltransferase family 2 protein [Bdellovibrionales bacterium]|nr:glycosyltransferase family 2 protein [Bdellovibrionales bacterium]
MNSTQTMRQASSANSAAPLVAIVIVHYDCLADTRRCIESVRSLSYPRVLPIVVDGRSPNETAHPLTGELKRFGGEVLFAPVNGGFAFASNLGMRQALAKGAELIWLLNPDTTVDRDALTELVREMQSASEVAAVCSKVLYAPREGAPTVVDRHRIWSAGATLDLENGRLSMIGNGEPDEGQYEAGYDCGYLPGCSLLMRSAALESVGYLREEFFMYFEETDWCARARRKGYRLRYVPGSIVWHHFSDAKMAEPFGVYYYNRNERLFWFRWGSPSLKLRVIGRTLLKQLPSALRARAQAPDERHRHLFRAHVMSCLDFLFGRFGARWRPAR